MGKNIFEIVERLKKKMGFKTDSDVAQALGMSLGALSNHKTRRSIPYEALSSFCDMKSLSLDWLLTGEGPMGKEKEGYPPAGGEDIAEYGPLYNNVKGDPELGEILRYFIENPQDKKFCLKMIRGKKEIKEAVEGFVSKNLIKEEG